jgi:hypothetical protein
VSAEGEVECTTGTTVLRRFTLVVDATSQGGRFTSATLHWSTPVMPAEETVMAVDGPSARVEVEELRGAHVVWWVAGTASGGRSDRTNAETLQNPCP